MKEIWKNINGYEGKYQVSSQGRVKSLKRKYRHNSIILIPKIDKSGYLEVQLSKYGSKKSIKIHRLMGEAFLTDTFYDENMVVDHIDNNKSNNNLNNLQIITRRQNSSKDQFRHNRSSKFVGVSLDAGTNKWRAQISVNNKDVYIGIFKTETEAVNAYKLALKIYNKL